MASVALQRARIVESTFGPMVVGPGDEIVELIWDETDPGRRVQLANAALALDGLCIEAYLVLAEHSTDPCEAAVLLSKAVKAGSILWTPVVRERGDVDWWDFPGTRPYMRAIHGLGRVLAELGEVERARACFEMLLDMHPRDSQGVRSDLARLEAHATGVPESRC